MPGGRPTKYDPAYCEQVVKLGGEGLSECEIAVEIGVARGTLHLWKETHPEFLAALTRAKEAEQAWWERTGRKALFADKFNSAVWSKSMSARFRDEYTDRVKSEVTGKDGEPLFRRANELAESLIAHVSQARTPEQG
jgi:hypothetical protein